MCPFMFVIRKVTNNLKITYDLFHSPNDSLMQMLITGKKILRPGNLPTKRKVD